MVVLVSIDSDGRCTRLTEKQGRYRWPMAERRIDKPSIEQRMTNAV